MDAFSNPSLIYTKPTTYKGCYVALALHLYHALVYTMNASDVFHHVVFAFLGIGSDGKCAGGGLFSDEFLSFVGEREDGS